MYIIIVQLLSNQITVSLYLVYPNVSVNPLTYVTIPSLLPRSAMVRPKVVIVRSLEIISYGHWHGGPTHRLIVAVLFMKLRG